MEVFKKISKEINENKYKYIFNAMLLQFVILSIAVTILNIFFKFFLFLSNQNNLTLDNIYEILTNPFGILGLIIYVVITVIFIFIEFYYLINIIMGINRIRITDMLKKIKEIFDFDMIFLIIYFILMIPFANLGLSSMLTEELYIPKFITDEVIKTRVGLFLVVLVSLILIILNFFLIFTMPLTIINNNSVFKNMKKSFKIIKKYWKKIILNVLVFEIIIFLLFSSFILITYLLVLVLNASNNLILNTLLLTSFNFSKFLIVAFTKIFIITLLINILKSEGELNIFEEKKKRKIYKKLTVIFIFLFFIFSFVFNYSFLQNNKLNENILIISHRGYVRNAIENTLKSIEDASKNGANIVEIDIILTKDNKFILSHDNNLKRLAKINKKVSDMTLNELKELNIYNKNLVDKIPSFKEAVETARNNNIKLLVELKTHGSEDKNYIDLVIEEFNNLNINDYPVMSIDKNIMEELEKKAPYLKTGHVIPIQFGIFDKTNLDFYVIEDFSYSLSLNIDKELYIFTINDDSLMRKYLQSNVSGIITDRLDRIKDNKRRLKNENTYLKKVRRIIGII